MGYEIRQAHIDTALTALSSQLTNEGFVADQLVRTIPVGDQTGLFYRHFNEHFIIDDDIRAPGSKVLEAPGLYVATENYHCQEHALQRRVTDEERAAADSPLRPDADVTNVLMTNVMLAREKRVVEIVTDGDRFPDDLKSTPSTKWDTAGAKLISEVRTARDAIHKRIFREPNVMVIPRQVVNKMLDNTDILDRIKYTQTGVTTVDLLSSLFGMQVLVPGTGGILKGTDPGGDSVPQAPGGTNTRTGSRATSAATTGFNYVWPDKVLLAHVPPLPSTRATGFLMEFVWTGPYNSVGTTNVFRLRDDETRSDIIQVSRYYDFKLLTIDETRTGNDHTLAGYLFEDVLS